MKLCWWTLFNYASHTSVCIAQCPIPILFIFSFYYFIFNLYLFIISLRITKFVTKSIEDYTELCNSVHAARFFVCMAPNFDLSRTISNIQSGNTKNDWMEWHGKVALCWSFTVQPRTYSQSKVGFSLPFTKKRH